MLNSAEGFGMPPFEYWLSLSSKNYRWRCELCPNITATVLNSSCDCIASRADYRSRYSPEIDMFDEVYHYQVNTLFYYKLLLMFISNNMKMFGYLQNKRWDCDKCNFKPRNVEDSVTNCPQAQQNYASTFGGILFIIIIVGLIQC